MLSQRLRRWPNIEPTLNKCTMFESKSSAAQQTQDICIKFLQRRPNVFDFGPPLHEVIQMSVNTSFWSQAFSKSPQ